jgi:hypothetical protein
MTLPPPRRLRHLSLLGLMLWAAVASGQPYEIRYRWRDHWLRSG